ncbi:biotin transporter BioY [Thermococcus sp.]
MKAKEVTYTALFIALTAVSAQISIPIGEVPITLQVLAVLLSGFVLGSKLGFLSQFLYVIMGAIGFPVFANSQGGFGVIYGPTGGYLIAFPIAAYLVGYVSEKKDGLKWYFSIALMGIFVIYLLGWLRLGFFIGGDFKKAFAIGVLPFIWVDLIKAGVAVAVAERIKKSGIM